MTLETLLLTVSVTLAALNETRLDVYFSLFTIVYFIAAMIFSPRRRWRDFLGTGLLMIFVIISTLRVLEILLG